MAPMVGKRFCRGEGMRTRVGRSVARANLCIVCVVAIATLTACQGEKSKSKVAATVDGLVITADAVNGALAQLGVSKNTTEQQRRLTLDALVTQAVFVNAALGESLDQDPAVRVRLESARRKILAKAYIDRHTANLPAPSSKAIEAYFDAHPELFSNRRIYHLQEIAIQASAEQAAEAKKQYEQIHTLNDMVAWLKANGVHYKADAFVKPAEDLPADFLPVLARMKEGDTARVQTKGGFTIVQVVSAQKAPVNLQQAKPAISRYLKNQVTGAAIASLTKALRARATIKYFPPFGPPSKPTG